MTKQIPTICLECGRRGGMIRGMCRNSCYRKAYSRGDHVERERPTLSRDELLEEWCRFDRRADIPHTHNIERFAARLGRTHSSVERSLLRAGITAACPVPKTS